MTSRSSSIHTLNADRTLNLIQKAFYLLLNWINNRFPYSRIDQNLVIKNATFQNLRSIWDRLDINTTPARRLSDLFWFKLPWDKIGEELEEINILDIGCGLGNYGSKLEEYSNNNIASYTGIDIYEHENWTKLHNKHPKFRFQQLKDNNISDYIPKGTNFFMTQSAIEHVDSDLIYFKQIMDYICSYKRSVIQVHLFPSSACLRLYLFHGIRQYTPRTISKITRLFSVFSNTTLFRLGGKECIQLHYDFITKPVLIARIDDIINQRSQEYEKRLLMAIEHDMKYPTKVPNFYALVIHSNQRTQIF